MSLHLLNAGGVLEKRFSGMVGPSRVAMALAQHHGRARRRHPGCPGRRNRLLGPDPQRGPARDAALRLFDGLRLLAQSPDFYELKRTRTSPPDVWYPPDNGDDERRNP